MGGACGVLTSGAASGKPVNTSPNTNGFVAHGPREGLVRVATVDSVAVDAGVQRSVVGTGALKSRAEEIGDREGEDNTVVDTTPLVTEAL